MKRLHLILILSLFLFTCSENKSKIKSTPKKEIENAFYDRAFEYRQKNKSDSAFKYFSLAKDLFAAKG